MTPVSCSRHHGSSAAANSRRIAENGGCSVSTWPTRSAASSWARHVVVRQPDGAHLSLRLEVEQRAPVLLDRRSVLGRPVHLVEVDAVEAKPAQRVLELAADAGGRADVARECLAVVLVPGEAALGEHVRAPFARDLLQRLAHDLLGVPEAVDRGSIDPVDAALDRVTDRGDRLPVVLRAPTDRPVAASDGPGAEADGVICMSVRPKRRLGSAPLFATALSE